RAAGDPPAPLPITTTSKSVRISWFVRPSAGSAAVDGVSAERVLERVRPREGEPALEVRPPRDGRVPAVLRVRERSRECVPPEQVEEVPRAGVLRTVPARHIVPRHLVVERDVEVAGYVTRLAPWIAPAEHATDLPEALPVVHQVMRLLAREHVVDVDRGAGRIVEPVGPLDHPLPRPGVETVVVPRQEPLPFAGTEREHMIGEPLKDAHLPSLENDGDGALPGEHPRPLRAVVHPEPLRVDRVRLDALVDQELEVEDRPPRHRHRDGEVCRVLADKPPPARGDRGVE